MSSDNTKPVDGHLVQRRWLRFRVLAVTILVVAAVWWLWHQASRRLLASVLRDGAEIVACPGPLAFWNFYGMTGHPNARYLTVDRDVCFLLMAESRVPAERIPELVRFPKLYSLHLNGEQFGPRLTSLSGVPTLQIVEAEGPGLNDGLAALPHLKHLRQLHLYDSELDQQQLAGLASLSELRRLSVGRVTSSGMTVLGGLTQIESLEIHTDETISASMLEPLANCPKLTEITLHGKAIEDSGWNSLSQLTALRIVVLRTPLTAEGEFSPLDQLKSVELRGILPGGAADYVERIKRLAPNAVVDTRY